MTTLLTVTLRTAALAATLVVLPLVFLQLRNGSGTGFPAALFVLLWTLPLVFAVLFAATARSWRMPSRSTWVVRIGGVVGLLLIAGMWIAVVADQMPCFLGVPNCD